MFIRTLIEVFFRIIVIILTGPLLDTSGKVSHLILTVNTVILSQTSFRFIFN